MSPAQSPASLSTVKALEAVIERLKNENAELRRQLDEGFQDAVKEFSAVLHRKLQGRMRSQ